MIVYIVMQPSLCHVSFYYHRVASQSADSLCITAALIAMLVAVVAVMCRIKFFLFIKDILSHLYTYFLFVCAHSPRHLNTHTHTHICMLIYPSILSAISLY